jgi:cellulose synthase/poly-beta-1,6-N-acetylglucosamine synthase-like glycosyltransferase
MVLDYTASIIFIISLLLLVYAYAGYAAVLKALVSVLKPGHKRNNSFQPDVTILVPVYNEERVIRKKIENCLALDYPRKCLEILICSDCSTDKTEEIVREYIEKGVQFLDYRTRSGKTGVINKSIPKARGEIIVLTDANTMFGRDAVLKMVRMYSSEKIGAVLGQVQLEVPPGGHGVEKEVVYREFETHLKYNEGLLGAAIGAFGGFYSIRKSLFSPLPDNAYSNDDLLIPMRILCKGYRVIMDYSAISREETGQSVEEEFTRRVRIGAGNFQSFFLMLYALNPLRLTTFFLYISHKVLRWFSPFLLITLLISNLFLLHSVAFRLCAIGQGIFYGAAILGLFLSRMKAVIPVISSIYHFVSMNSAVLLGFIRYIRGIRSATWESTERAHS